MKYFKRKTFKVTNFASNKQSLVNENLFDLVSYLNPLSFGCELLCHAILEFVFGRMVHRNPADRVFLCSVRNCRAHLL